MGWFAQSLNPLDLVMVVRCADDDTKCSVGRLDHWILHMRGLKKVLDVTSNLDNLPEWLLAAMHKFVTPSQPPPPF